MTANGGFGSLCLSSLLPGTLRSEWLAVVYLVVALGRSRPQRRALLRVSRQRFRYPSLRLSAPWRASASAPHPSAPLPRLVSIPIAPAGRSAAVPSNRDLSALRRSPDRRVRATVLHSAAERIKSLALDGKQS